MILTFAALAFSVSLSGGKSITTWHGQADHSSITFEWSRPRTGSRHTEIGVVVAPHAFYQPRSWFGDQYRDGNEPVRAISAGVVARRWLSDEWRTIRPYVEITAGPMWGEKQIPAATSRFNFVTQPGIGVVIGGRERLPIIIGYRFAHVSNGGYSPRNPGLNVSEVTLGVRFGDRRGPPPR